MSASAVVNAEVEEHASAVVNAAEEEHADDDSLAEDEEDARTEDTDSHAEGPVRKRIRRNKDDQLSIPREVVRQIVREIVTKLRPDTRVDKQGMLALHTAVEAYASDLFMTTESLVQMSDRSTVTPEFLKFALGVHDRIRLAAAQS